ncbi:P-loop containing nucleoside triphosphate hydrolase protein [Xylona heveae TC161]|uniref:RNA helicase n=1 Tax=Xylona heveae (strain CBS 132557 / TC161) TaxID=1328760 RepID=A0A161TEK6_XYLHT|nr:P-loop containing nucleoside triphosphate hydrolase protein [Xylona heveae TC161]KZF24367.1 P-loop containing nucleoside triphosphate hydrolase protein [Xylona heveae TC161]
MAPKGHFKFDDEGFNDRAPATTNINKALEEKKEKQEKQEKQKKAEKFEKFQQQTQPQPHSPQLNGEKSSQQQQQQSQVLNKKRKREDNDRDGQKRHQVKREDNDREGQRRHQGHSGKELNGKSERLNNNGKGRNGSPVNSSLKAKANALLSKRKDLPIWAHQSEIRQSLAKKNVMLLVGETGSGKSTQVPQFLSTEPWCRPQMVKVAKDGKGPIEDLSVGGCIAITQPRRVAAISLARRVAEEMGTPLGNSSPASTVGYSVRFDNSISRNTKIKFLTEGMLLQEMLRDPWLRQYSAVVVDEIHERGVNVDLVAGFLQKMVSGKNEGRGGIPLKVVVMSATADMEGLLKFFDAGFKQPTAAVNGKGQKAIKKDEEETEWSGISSDDNKASKKAYGTPNGTVSKPGPNTDSKSNALVKKHKNGNPEGDESAPFTEFDPVKFGSPHISVCFIEGRQFPVKIFYTPEPVQDFVDAALHSIFQIHYKEPLPGDILVFLTGQDTVENLEQLVREYASGMSPELPKLLVLPLFAALPQAAQQRVFQPTPPKTRKVILATNIAETSVTVSGVRYVIDCGKVKIKQFRNRLGLDSLLVKPLSKSAAIQRKGRAGREAPGQCYRLYTEKDYLQLAQANTPEILRCDISQAILTMKARGIDDIINFPFLDRPPREALEKALLQLYQLGALQDDGAISEVGLKIAKLPLTPSLGRVLLAAANPDMDCLLEAIDIISALSVENVFLNLTSEEKKEEAETARRDISRREGDHLTLLATVQAYAGENSDRKAWSERHFVSHRAMQAVMDVRKQLRAQTTHLPISADDIVAYDSRTYAVTPERAGLILRCFLKGFSHNTARMMPDGSYKTIIGNQTVAIHPSSGLFGKKVEAIMYNEFVFTNKSYARGVSGVQMDWVGEALA